MKKTLRQEDGSFVTIEGTAEEIRQYERIVESDRRGQEPKKQSPDVLKGAPELDADQIRKILEDLGMRPQLQETRPVQPIVPRTVPYHPSWCPRCGGLPCVCDLAYPAWPLYPGQIWCKTVTVSSDSTYAGDRFADDLCLGPRSSVS